MRFLLLIIGLGLSAGSSAGIFKCEVDGKKIYQSKPCKKGKVEEFQLKKDISDEQKAAARAAHEAFLQNRAEQQARYYEMMKDERKIAAEEVKAIGELQNARQSARQADALEQRNRLEIIKMTTQRY